ncbi:MAG: polysaccharide biosynthesis protein [Lachnospiraceae bacterium]|nr:polysaccharide biosynthesis protein [Lachnospiraceae bacterium]
MAEKKKGRREANFLIQGSILAIASVIVRLIGIIYRIPLTNILGDGGNAAYTNAYEIYSLIWMIASFGIPTAVSKMVAERIGNKQEQNAGRVFGVAILFATVVGGTAFCILFFGAGFFAHVVYKRAEIEYALMVLAPTVWVSAFLGAFRGFFQGHGTMVPTAVSQIVEQIINAVMSILGAWVLWNMGHRLDLLHSEDIWSDTLGAAGGTVGTLSGAVAGLLVCIVIYRMYYSSGSRELTGGSAVKESRKSLLSTLVLMILPITLNSAIYNISSVLDSTIFSNYADMAGMSSQAYQISWNAYSGKYHLLTHVPLAFATALSASAVPNLSRTLKTSAPSEITHKIRTAIRFAMLIAIPSCVGLAVLSKPILQLLFAGTPESNDLASVLLKAGGITVILYSFSTITNGVLQGIGRVTEPAKNAAAALVAHLVILAVCLWVFPFGIYGVVIADIIFGLMMNIMNYRSIYRAIRFRLEIRYTFLLPGISSILMGAAAWGSYKGLYYLTSSNAFSVLLAICVAVVIYASALLLTGGITESDLKSFPKGTLLVRIAKKLHLLRK